MPGPSSSQQTQQTYGQLNPQAIATGNQALQQGDIALQNMQQATRNPLVQAKMIDQQIQSAGDKVLSVQAQLDQMNKDIDSGNAFWMGDWQAKRATLLQQKQDAQAGLQQLQAYKTVLPQLTQQYQSQQDTTNAANQRLNDYITGKNIGITPQEQQLIEQGLTGTLQDMATSRGLNTTDVPVMQAFAPTLAQTYMNQANANRSLFTGINQFQQGMGLSQQQLQAGIGGQNPAANLTGVYAGLTPSSFSTRSQQNYGGLDYLNSAANVAQGVGSVMTGTAGLQGKLGKGP